MQPGRVGTSGLRVPLPPLARWAGRVAPVCPTHGVLVLSCPSAALRVRGVPGHLAPVHRCAPLVWCVACAASWAPLLPFTGVPTGCVVLCVRCPEPLGSCSPVRLFRVLLCVRGVLGHLVPVHRCACSVFCFVCAVSWATWLLLTGVPARCVVLRIRCHGPLGSCSPVCPLDVLCCVGGVLGLLAPVHRCARPWCPVPLLFLVHARVRCPGPRGACSPVCALCAVRVCHWWLCPSSSSPNFRFLFLFELKKKTGARVHCRHKHGQLVQRCNSVVSSGVCRRCFGGGRAPGVRLARPDAHGSG